ncbi:MAG TPA: hypothetical protein VME40_09535 [Caulobacteraceae bacterium]|nr:hypothetical protein [Caulobacteraceae bacterium]
MWAKSLSGVALACNVLAMLFNIGLTRVVLADSPAGVSLQTKVFATLLAVFFVAGPLVASLTLLLGSPLARTYAPLNGAARE